jgi:hypothetical protein
MDLRPRNKDKEIGHGTFRHSATTRFEQVYDQLSKRTSSVIAPREILDPAELLKNRGKSVLQSSSLTPGLDTTFSSKANATEMTQLTRMSSLSKKLKSPLGKLPEIVRPTEVLSKLHDKTHFKAATSIFLDH